MKERYTWDKVNQWGEELGLLRSIIQQTELVETTKWGGEVYTINNKNVLGIGGFKSFFTVWFFNGVFLKDDAKVLVNANEGVTKGLRQWRFTSAEEVDETLLLQYILEAIANEKAGLSIKPEKKPAMHCDFLANELKKDPKLKVAFEQFSPYKQKEFWELMATAKQEKTKVTRFEKIKPLILEGRGLNDKYRK
ncbi:YdeI/OmpD-associated family protein [Flavobacterium sp. XGLA_31]|uniref:YdeI/OmpD-associated family protein n=1 Tax=Flavobacterium sp. XGLA_31 TaxID=3447666 RepID=UPI003F40FA81